MKTMLRISLLTFFVACGGGCSNIHLVKRGAKPQPVPAPIVAVTPPTPAKVTFKAAPATPEQSWSIAANKIVDRVLALQRSDRRVALPVRATASVFETRLIALIEQGLTQNGYRIVPELPAGVAVDDRAQLAVLSVETSLAVTNNPTVDIVARLVDRGDVVLAAADSLAVTAKEFSSYQAAGTFIGTDQRLRENPVKEFKIIRGE